MSDFNLHIDPGLTLSDSKITVTGQKVGSVYGKSVNGNTIYDYAQLGLDWLRDNHPDWITNKVWSIDSALKPSILMIKNQSPQLLLTPQALSHHTFNNSESDVPAEDEARLDSSVSETTSVTWSESQTIEETVSFEVGGEFAKTSASLSFSATVGKDESHEESFNVTSADETRVNVPAGEVILAILLISQGTLNIECNLEWYIQGGIYVGNLETGQRYYLSADKLQQYSRDPRSQFTLKLQFVSEHEIRTISIPNDDPTTIDNAIKHVLADATHHDGLKVKHPTKIEVANA